MHLKKVLGAVSVIAATSLLPDLAIASNTHNFANSKKLGVSVDFEIKNGQWCHETLSMILKAENKDFYNGQGITTFLPKVGKLVQRECAKAQTIEILGTDPKGLEALFAGTARLSDGWLPVSEPVVKQTSILPKPPLPTKAMEQKKEDVADLWEKAVPLQSSDVFYKYVGDNLELMQDEQFVRRYAGQAECDSYRVKAKDEFAIAAYLKSVEGKLSEKVKSGPLYVHAFYEHEIGTYDFGKKQFPAKMGGQFIRTVSESYRCRFDDNYRKFPFVYAPEDIPNPVFTAFPLDEVRASKLVKRQYDARRVFADYLIRINEIRYQSKPIGYGDLRSYGWQYNSPDAAYMNAELISVRVFADKKKKQLLHTFDQPDIQQAIIARKQEAEEKRLAALKAEQEKIEKETQARLERDRAIMQQRADRDRKRLQYASFKNKLSYLYGDVGSLSDLSDAVASSLITERSVRVNTLVQIEAVKDRAATVNWPIEMSLDLSASDLSDLKEKDWVLISGDLTSTNQSSKTAPKIKKEISIAVNRTEICQQARCGEVENIDYLISKTYPQLATNTQEVKQ